ncbi:MAG: APA family basic amino acid/polyamine antiporter [Myxococcota bacterium]|jgi:APA family basic amino acid/polyamine antiporter
MANMIGAGVFLSSGFMAQDMGPGPILLAWVVGGILAMLGALSYAELSRLISGSGGEYRYVGTMWHPMLGSMAGWGSLLLGFSAPVAIDGFAVGAFLNTLIEGPDPRITGTLLIVLLTMAHAGRRWLSEHTQNALIAIKIVLLMGFIVAGLAMGARHWPTWVAPSAEDPTVFPTAAFLKNQYWIAFAFSGWNAAAYVAGEFKEPTRDVPRALLIGCSTVGVLYLLVNWIFVANLTPAELSVVFEYEASRVTLGHALVAKMGSPLGAIAMSVFAILAFSSAMSAMTLVGPRVYSEMARDGYLPEAFIGTADEPPRWAVLLQGVLAIMLLWTHSLLEAVESAGGMLLLFSMLSTSGLMLRRDARPAYRLAAGLYTLGALGILGYGIANHPHQLLWFVGLAVFGGLAYTRRRRPEARTVVPTKSTAK